MASSADTDTGVGDEDINRETSDGKDKKRKLKPFEAFRKLFSKSTRKRGSSKKDEGQVSIVSVKAKSTTALDSGARDTDDEEDDSGFKNTRTTLQGTRSISEDSVFNPEPKETNPESLKKIAVSEENLHKSTFKAELFAKLKSRQSVYADDDDDTDVGLPHSPIPPVTTADLIMGGGLKPLPVSGKSMSRESDLISEDVSDNEEDTFNREWKSSVASINVKSKEDKVTRREEKTMIDLSSVESTQVLSNRLSKDKLSIKPPRKARGQSRKKKEEKTTTPLPGLKEESPTKIQPSSFPEESPSISQSLPTKAPEVKPSDVSTSQSTTSTVTKTVINVNKSQTEVISSSTVNSDNVVKPSLKIDTEESSSANKTELSNVFSKLRKPSSTEGEVSSKSVQESNVIDSKEAKVIVTETKQSVETTTSIISSSSVKTSSTTKSVEEPKKSVTNLRTTNETDIVSSPKEEYKLKRQNRSKTLPVASDVVKDEKPTVSVQRANSQRFDPEASPKVLVSKRQSVVLPITPASRPIENKRLSWIEPASKSSGEPDWLANLRKKKQTDKDEKSPTEESKPIVIEKKADKVPEMRKKSIGDAKPPVVATKSSPVKTPEMKVVGMKATEVKETETIDKPLETKKAERRLSTGTKPLNITTQPAKTEPLKTDSTSSTTSPTNSIASRINSLKITSTDSTKSYTEKTSGSLKSPISADSKLPTSVASKPVPLSESSSKPSATPSTVAKPVTTSVAKPVTTSAVVKPAITSSVVKPATTSSVVKPVTTSIVSKASTVSVATKPTVSKPQTITSTPKTAVTTHTVSKPVVTKPITSPISSKPFSTSAPYTAPATSFVKNSTSSVSQSDTKTTVSQTSSKSFVHPKTVSSAPVKPATSPLTESQPKTAPASEVPAWRRNLSQKKVESSMIAPMKIELIENSSPLPKTEKKVEKKITPAVKTESPTDKWSDNNGGKSTKVSDLLKNFQKFEVV